MFKTKPGFLLRRLGDESMVIAIGPASDQFNGMIRLNDTGAFYWELLTAGATQDQLIAAALDQYTGISEADARRDVEAFLHTIAFALESDAADH